MTLTGRFVKERSQEAAIHAAVFLVGDLEIAAP
jgi:hypothetical protein